MRYLLMLMCSCEILLCQTAITAVTAKLLFPRVTPQPPLPIATDPIIPTPSTKTPVVLSCYVQRRPTSRSRLDFHGS